VLEGESRRRRLIYHPAGWRKKGEEEERNLLQDLVWQRKPSADRFRRSLGEKKEEIGTGVVFSSTPQSEGKKKRGRQGKKSLSSARTGEKKGWRTILIRGLTREEKKS